jgi:hypothetical protein
VAGAGLPVTVTTVAGSELAPVVRLQPVTWLLVIPKVEEPMPDVLPEPVEVRVSEPAVVALT